MFTRRLALAVACALLVLLVAAAVAAAAPRSAPPGKAAAIAGPQRVGVGDALPLPGMDFYDTLVAPDYEDLWTVYLAAGQQITVTMTAAATEDFDIALWAPGTTDITNLNNAVAVSRHAGSNESYSYVVPSGADGSYYIDVWSFSSTVTDGSYHLTVAIGAPNAGIPPIPSADFSDSLEAPGYEDCWTVDAAPGQQLIITMDSPSGGDFDLCLWAPGTTDFTYHYSESLVVSAHYSGAEDFKYIVPAGAGGAYIVDVWSDTLGGTYRLRVNKQSPSTTAVRITPPAVPLRCVTGRNYTSYGTLKPLHYVDDSSVRVQMQKFSGGHWRAAVSGMAENKNYSSYTRYKIAYRFYGSGHGTMRWRARGIHLADELHPRKVSSWRYFTVRI